MRITNTIISTFNTLLDDWHVLVLVLQDFPASQSSSVRQDVAMTGYLQYQKKHKILA